MRNAPLPARIGAAILGTQPLLYYPLDDAGGAVFREIAHGFHAAITGAPVQVPGIGDGQGALQFASGFYALSAQPPQPTTAISIMALIKTSDATASQRIACSRYASTNQCFTLGLGSTHLAQWTLYQSGGTAHCSVNATGALNTGRWKLLICTFDSTTAFVYRVDETGVITIDSSATLTGSWKASSTAGINIGSNQTTTLPFINGTIAHIAIWHKALTPADVRYLAQSVFG